MCVLRRVSCLITGCCTSPLLAFKYFLSILEIYLKTRCLRHCGLSWHVLILFAADFLLSLLSLSSASTTPGVGTTARYLKPFQSWCVSSPVYQLGRRVVVMRTRAVALRGNTLMAVGAHRRPWQGGRLLMAETKTAAPPRLRVFLFITPPSLSYIPRGRRRWYIPLRWSAPIKL